MRPAYHSHLTTWQWRLLAVGLLALIGFVVGAFLSPQQFFLSYLSAFLYWFGLASGAIGFLMLSHLTGGRWGFVLRRFFEASAGTMPLLALLFLPFLAGLGRLYPWMRSSAEDRVHSTGYFSPTAFTLRAVLYLAIWVGLAMLLRRWSRQQDQTQTVEPTRRLRQLSGPGLVLYFLTLSFASFDWIMSLEPHWFSTIFALIVVVSHGLSAFALAVLLLVRWRSEEPLQGQLDATLHNKLGNILLALVMLWAYLSFSQLLIIYAGNLPEEISWYIHRFQGGWLWCALALAGFQFFVPFGALLFRSNKRQPHRLFGLAFLLLVMQLVHVWWLVQPSVSVRAFSLSWMDLAALVGMGGLWFALFLHQLKQAPLIPLNDPREAL